MELSADVREKLIQTFIDLDRRFQIERMSFSKEFNERPHDDQHTWFLVAEMAEVLRGLCAKMDLLVTIFNLLGIRPVEYECKV